MIESACMMLDHINEPEISSRIKKAVATVIEEGKIKTYDMMKLSGTPDVTDQGAASTKEMANAIISKL